MFSCGLFNRIFSQITNFLLCAFCGLKSESNDFFTKNLNFFTFSNIKYIFLYLDIEEFKDIQSDAKPNDTHRIDCLEQQLKEKDVLIEQLIEQINQMKNGFHAWVERAETGCSSTCTTQETATVNGENVDRSSHEEQTHVAKIPIKDDESYFMTYARYDIHYDMLSVSSTATLYTVCIDKNLHSTNCILFSGHRSYKQLP